MSESIPVASILPGQTSGHSPGIWKIFSNARPCGKFLLANAPIPRSFCGGQMPGPPVHPINIQSYWLPYFNKHNCFSSIELHKNRSQNESLRLINDKANGSIAFIGFLWSINAHLLQNDCLKPLTLSAVGNDDRMLRNKFVVV